MDIKNSKQNDIESAIEREIIENMNNEEWGICCSHSSKHFIKYLITVIICIIVLLFSMYMIIDNPNQDNSIYFSLISSILSLYIPSPQIEKLREYR